MPRQAWVSAVLAACLFPAVALGQSVDPDWPMAGGDAKAEQGKPAETPAAEASWTTIKTTYKAVKKFEFALPPVEGATTASGVAVSSRLALPSSALGVTKDGKKLGIDTNGDSTPDVWVKSEKDVQQFELNYDGAKEPYAVELLRDASNNWTYSRACMRVASHKGARILLIDNDSDGAYDEAGVDAVLVGTAKVPAYLGSQIAVGGKVFEMKVNRSGSEIQVREVATPMGKVDLPSGFRAAGKLVGAVLSDGQRSFDCSSACSIPVGTYTLKWGVVQGGARSCQFRSALSVTVSEDAVAKVEFGGPFKLDFTASREGANVSIPAHSLTVTGKAGETYYDFSHHLFPSFEIRNEVTKQGLCKGKMSAC